LCMYVRRERERERERGREREREREREEGRREAGQQTQAKQLTQPNIERERERKSRTVGTSTAAETDETAKSSWVASAASKKEARRPTARSPDFLHTDVAREQGVQISVATLPGGMQTLIARDSPAKDI
jgi:hypothetical protein